MKILMVSSEVAPYAKTGGLGDVLGALPQALAKLGHDVRVVMPKYGCIKAEHLENAVFKFFIYVPLGWRNKYCGVFEKIKDGVTYYFIDNEFYFGDPYIYKWDDLERFAFLDKAALEILPNLKFTPDVIHCHDWQAGMIPLILNAYYKKDMFYRRIKTVFTIHNLRYQGLYDSALVADFFSLGKEFFTDDKLEFFGCANLLKGGITYSNYITTVSPTYAEEIKTIEYGEKLDGLLRARRNSLFGILNGVDYDEFSPKTDTNIFENYDGKNFVTGKRANKLKLQEQLGLPVNDDIPMIGIVSRLVDQKGFDLIRASMDELVKLNIQLVIVGTGEEKYENMFKQYAWCNPAKVSANILFDNSLAHKVYAASDLFLMPSLFEPCGLSQIISLSYGTLPIIRETGGLKDTILSYNEATNEGNGFSFANYSAHDMIYTINRALSFYNDKNVWRSIIRRGMKENFSWEEAAKKYIEVYEK